MILDNHYAVVFKATGAQIQTKAILTNAGWESLKILARDGHFVILECWDISKGKCVSN